MTGTIMAGTFGGGFPVNAVNFDSSNDFLDIASDFTGNANSKLITGSIWAKGTGHIISSLSTGAINIQISSGLFFLDIENTIGGAGVEFNTTTTSMSTSTWYNILFSIDSADESASRVFITPSGGTMVNQSLNVSSWVDTTLNFTDSNGFNMFANSSDTNKFNGDVAEAWLDFGSFLDLTSGTNRGEYVSLTGKPVDLGLDGSNPSLGQPLIFLSGDTDSWHTNKGTGGGFTENGALTTASTSPSD